MQIAHYNYYVIYSYKRFRKFGRVYPMSVMWIYAVDENVNKQTGFSDSNLLTLKCSFSCKSWELTFKKRELKKI